MRDFKYLTSKQMKPTFAYCVVPENIHTHPKEGYWKFQGGGGVSKAQFFKEKYGTKMELPEEVGGGGSS